MVEHEVIIDRVGGATVITCKAVELINAELLGGKLTEDAVKATILHHKHIPSDDERAKFDIKIIDNRPESEENYNEKRRQESLERKPKNKNFI